MKKLSCLLGILMLFFVACKKDKPDAPVNPQTVAGLYTLTGLKAKAGSGPQVDVYNQLTECQQRDTWDFREGGEFRYGGVQTGSCSSEDDMGTWNLTGKSFTITNSQNSTTYQLESFDGRALVLSTDGTLNSDPATFFVTFTRK